MKRNFFLSCLANRSLTGHGHHNGLYTGLAVCIAYHGVCRAISGTSRSAISNMIFTTKLTLALTLPLTLTLTVTLTLNLTLKLTLTLFFHKPVHPPMPSFIDMNGPEVVQHRIAILFFF